MERETEAQQFKRRKNKDPQTAAIITNLHKELADLNQQKKLGLISTAEHKMNREPIVAELHQVMRESERNPVRTKRKSP